MAQRELEVTVISAQGLKNVRLYGRLMNPYAVAWVYPSHKVQTVVDEGGGINPSWNSVLRFSCEDTVIWSSGGEITIVIRNRGSISNKLIGTVTVPLSDLSLQCRAADSNASPESTLMSYQVLAISFLGIFLIPNGQFCTNNKFTPSMVFNRVDEFSMELLASNVWHSQVLRVCDS